MLIEASTDPDDKDWTWVLQRRCPECHLEARSITREDVAHRVRDSLLAWTAALARPDIRQRPAPRVWSPLEYGCHTHDVFRVFDQRLALMLDQDAPTFASWDQDAAALEHRYWEADPATLAREIADAGEKLALRFVGVRPDQWLRPGSRSDGARFTVESFAQYLLHDVAHHLWDIGSRTTL